jgi:hypothetical protein
MGFSKHLSCVGIKKLDQAKGTDGAKGTEIASNHWESPPKYKVN